MDEKDIVTEITLTFYSYENTKSIVICHNYDACRNMYHYLLSVSLSFEAD
jgi:hypothetical protein